LGLRYSSLKVKPLNIQFQLLQLLDKGGAPSAQGIAMASSTSLPLLLGSATLLTVLGFIAGKSTEAKSSTKGSLVDTQQRHGAQLHARRPGASSTAFAALAGEGFFDKLTARAKAIDSLLCVGLDPHLAQLEQKTARGAFEFCKNLIDATTDVALAYKPNAAFFEAFGAEGMAALKDVVQVDTT
jgi:hypothetical protein